MPGFDARHATRRARRARVVVTLVVLGVAAFVAVHVGLGSSRRTTPPRRTPAPAPRVTSTLASWRLAAPISRAVVLTGTAPGATQLVILGGSTTGGTTATGIFTLDVADGTLSQIGDLTGALDEAAGAVIGSRDVVFGGASPEPSAAVQAFPATGLGSGSVPAGASPAPSSVIGALPTPRAGAAAVTVGSTTYIVGGADGSLPDAAVLATNDGTTFATVATLALPVRFPAVAALGGMLYVFGGLAVTGRNAGLPVGTIQVVDPTTHTDHTGGSLPEPLAGAAAVTLGGHVLLAGGQTTAPVTGTPATGAPATGTSAATSTTVPPGTTVPAGTTAASSSTVSTVWVYEPDMARCVVVGRLPVPVSYAGAAVEGDAAWLVGGESDATPVSAGQRLVLSPRRAPSRHTSSSGAAH
jgi:N-acetylneuraminic acid mutarotase